MRKLLLAIITTLAFTSPSWAAVDINSATQAQLQSIRGIGPRKAQAIIEYRRKNGPFKSVEDLDKVPGFGQKTVQAVKKDITVGNTKAAASGKAMERKTVREQTEIRAAGSETAAGHGQSAGNKMLREKAGKR